MGKKSRTEQGPQWARDFITQKWEQLERKEFEKAHKEMTKLEEEV